MNDTHPAIANGQPFTVRTGTPNHLGQYPPGSHHAARLHAGILCPHPRHADGRLDTGAQRDGTWHPGLDDVDCPDCLTDLASERAA